MKTMANVKALNGEAVPVTVSVEEFLEQMKEGCGKYNRAIVVLIEDRAGSWQTCWSMLGLSAIEVNFALDLTKRQVVETLARDPV